ncbi:MAG: transcriptional repressor [Streptococcaceae bacterium]|nr:transcriptional repressor [Streptococcaceae bacterium]
MTQLTPSVTFALAKLKEHGYKYTLKREIILTFLAQKNCYTSAKEIYNHLKQSFKGVSYDTIYRNLDTLVSLDLVEVTELSNEQKFLFHREGAFYSHHHHFICTYCGFIKEIALCPISDMTADLDDYHIEGHKFEIYGMCPQCIKEKAQVSQLN